jgi:hypothetical protein
MLSLHFLLQHELSWAKFSPLSPNIIYISGMSRPSQMVLYDITQKLVTRTVDINQDPLVWDLSPTPNVLLLGCKVSRYYLVQMPHSMIFYY